MELNSIDCEFVELEVAANLPVIPDFSLERRLKSDYGKRCIIGVDEAGRGSWAGVLAHAAIYLPFDCDIAGINDSKKLSPKRRIQLVEMIRARFPNNFALSFISNLQIDKLGLARANALGIQLAVERLLRKLGANNLRVYHVLLDGFLPKRLRIPVSVSAVKKGDMRSRSVAAASLFAKVYRDELMHGAARRFPDYAFDRHKGYGTALHRRRIREHGVCSLHRRSFKPIASFTK